MGSPSDFSSARSDKKPALLVRYESGRDELLKFHNQKDRMQTYKKLNGLSSVKGIKLTYWESEWR
ncbi:MAG: hypothetical protein ABFD79_14705 [Phycisphaerales bacterium]